MLRYAAVSEIFYGLRDFVTAYNVHNGSYPVAATAMAYVNHGVGSCAVGLVVLLGAAQISALLVSPLAAKQAEPDNAEASNV
ncbi:hypothetical protein [Dyella sp. 2HG41-7]|uniref:hypothetical protein n=1 Tax=Dyella sp. 2HG41-7 TaxID=2883239 RepID=UPI001F423877|nr:hypothetical protein [Dyella sp. 2HG41-7]